MFYFNTNKILNEISSSTPGRCFSSHKGPLYGASRESRIGIVALKESVTQNWRKRDLLLSEIVIFSKSEKKLGPRAGREWNKYILFRISASEKVSFREAHGFFFLTPIV